MKGRLTKFDEERAAIILEKIAEGLTRECVAALAGVTDRTLRSWVARGGKGEEPFASFSSALKKAERGAEAYHVAIVKKAGDKHWYASAWWLERKFPESWGKDTEIMREIIAEFRKRKKRVGNKKQTSNP
jgi:hypothetical protein